MTTPALQHTVRALLEPTVQRLGYDLVAIEWVTGKRRPVLRLSIDGPEGIGADDCATVSHRVSPLLDEADPIASAYTLEVSSPGIERPVQRPDDFRRFAGYTVKIRLEKGLPRRRYTGIIRGVDDGLLRLEADDEIHEIDLDSIQRAHLVLDFDAFERFAEEGLPPIPDADDASDSHPAGSDGGPEGA